jgi:predicted  nucleic acid-binding Zn-ribbon protein
MKPSHLLVQLQDFDSQLVAYHEQITKLHAILTDHSEIQQLDDLLNIDQIAIEKITEKLSQLDKEISEKKIKIQLSESNLYNGKIINPKELQDIQSEIVYLIKQKQINEQDELLLMQKLEEVEIKCEATRLKLQEATNQKFNSDAQINASIDQVNQEILKLDEKRLALVRQIDKDLLLFYDDLRSRKKGIAVARIEDLTCNMCGAEISSSERQVVRQSSTLEFCPSCRRILYCE